MKSKKTVIVLGHPRGGTSATAGILDILGVDFGNIRDSDHLNPTGYYEDIDFLKLMNKIYNLYGEDYNGFNPPPRHIIPKNKKTIEEISRDFFQKKYSFIDSSHYGLKIIGGSLRFFDFFTKYLKNPFFIIILRNPKKVAESTKEYTDKKGYNEMSINDSLKLYESYLHDIKEILEKYSDVPSLLVSFEDIKNDPGLEGKRMASFLEIQIDDKKTRKINDFIKTDEEMKNRKLNKKYQSKIHSIRSLTKRAIKNPKSIIGYFKNMFGRDRS